MELDYFYSGLYSSLLETEPDGKDANLLRAALFYIYIFRPLTPASHRKPALSDYSASRNRRSALTDYTRSAT